MHLYVKNGYLFVAVYSNAIQENMNALLYPGLIEELVDIVEVKDDNLVVSIQSQYIPLRELVGLWLPKNRPTFIYIFWCEGIQKQKIKNDSVLQCKIKLKFIEYGKFKVRKYYYYM